MLESIFPGLIRVRYDLTSPKDVTYNCIAWAAGDTDNWWWPVGDGYWPANVPHEVTVDAFSAAYGTLGYEVCGQPELEPGVERIALFLDMGNGRPTHAAKQLPDGRWTSKLGKLEDIIHESLDALCGDAYGEAKVFLRRLVE